MTTVDASKSSRLLAWLQLMRLPNVFTAMADVMMGFLFTHPSLSPLGVFLLLLTSSSCFYTTGMVLNDVFDVEQDRLERPHRPLPSGRVPLKVSTLLAFLLLVLGTIASGGAGLLAGDFRPAEIAALLCVAIFFYDAVLKNTRIGPLVMGGCRFLNVLLGMSASPVSWTMANWLIAGALGLYIVGVTVFARREAAASQRGYLIGALATMIVGMSALSAFPIVMLSELQPPIFSVQFKHWIMLWTGLAILIGWRFVLAIVRPVPEFVQSAVKSGILAIIALDALIVFPVRGASASICILLLLVPAILLGRWVYST